MALQYLTTREPDDGMIEVALVSFLAAEGNMTDEEIAALAEKYGHKIDGPPVEKGNARQIRRKRSLRPMSNGAKSLNKL